MPEKFENVYPGGCLYRIEKRDTETGYWVVQMDIRPNYQVQVTDHKFLWFKWQVTHLLNLRDANLEARRRAIFQAKSMYKIETHRRVYIGGRTMKVTTHPSYDLRIRHGSVHREDDRLDVYFHDIWKNGVFTSDH